MLELILSFALLGGAGGSGIFFYLDYKQGFPKSKDLLSKGTQLFKTKDEVRQAADIVKKSGSWFSYGETRLGQGRENSKKYFVDNPELFEEVRTKVLIARGVLDDPNATEESASTETPTVVDSD